MKKVKVTIKLELECHKYDKETIKELVYEELQELMLLDELEFEDKLKLGDEDEDEEDEDEIEELDF